MKKLCKFLLYCLTGIMIISGCASTSKLKDVSGPTERLEHKGTAYGVAEPDWVAVVIQNETNQTVLKKALGINKHIFVLTGRGKNLDFLQKWVDQEVQVNVAKSINTIIADLTETEIEGDSGNIEKRFDEKSTNAVIEMIAGLNKETDWWSKTRSHPDKKTDYTEQYNYTAVYSLDEKLWDKQINEAMKNKVDKETRIKLIEQLREYYSLIDLGEN